MSCVIIIQSFDNYSEYLIGLETRTVQHAHGVQLSLDCTWETSCHDATRSKSCLIYASRFNHAVNASKLNSAGPSLESNISCVLAHIRNVHKAMYVPNKTINLFSPSFMLIIR